MNERGITPGSLVRWTLGVEGLCCYLGRLSPPVTSALSRMEPTAGNDIVWSPSRGMIVGVDVDERYPLGEHLWELVWLAPEQEDR